MPPRQNRTARCGLWHRDVRLESFARRAAIASACTCLETREPAHGQQQRRSRQGHAAARRDAGRPSGPMQRSICKATEVERQRSKGKPPRPAAAAAASASAAIAQGAGRSRRPNPPSTQPSRRSGAAGGPISGEPTACRRRRASSGTRAGAPPAPHPPRRRRRRRAARGCRRAAPDARRPPARAAPRWASSRGAWPTSRVRSARGPDAGLRARVDELARSLGALGETQAKLARDTKALEAKIGSAQECRRSSPAASPSSRRRWAAVAADPAGQSPQVAALAGKLAELREGRREASRAGKRHAARSTASLSAIRTEAGRLGQRIDSLQGRGRGAPQGRRQGRRSARRSPPSSPRSSASCRPSPRARPSAPPTPRASCWPWSSPTSSAPWTAARATPTSWRRARRSAATPLEPRAAGALHAARALPTPPELAKSFRKVANAMHRCRGRARRRHAGRPPAVGRALDRARAQGRATPPTTPASRPSSAAWKPRSRTAGSPRCWPGQEAAAQGRAGRRGLAQEGRGAPGGRAGARRRGSRAQDVVGGRPPGTATEPKR